MSKGIAVAAVVITGSLALGGCSSGMDLTRSDSQMEVGVRAARINLWREALFRFQRAVQIAPTDAMAQNNLAVAYEGTGDFEKARAAYTEALRLDKSNQYIQKNYSRFVEFYSKNRKREQPRETGESATPAARATTAPVTTPPVPAPEAVPPQRPGTPEPLTPAPPPTTSQPTPPADSNGATR